MFDSLYYTKICIYHIIFTITYQCIYIYQPTPFAHYTVILHTIAIFFNNLQAELWKEFNLRLVILTHIRLQLPLTHYNCIYNKIRPQNHVIDETVRILGKDLQYCICPPLSPREIPADRLMQRGRLHRNAEGPE